MICLQCDQRQKGEAFEPCSSCGHVFQPVNGIYGVNNVTQLLHAIDECKAGRLSLEQLRQSFGAFAEIWEGFQLRWRLEQKPVPQLFELRPTLQGVYEEPLEQIEQAFIHLEDAFADLDELDTVDEAALQALAEEVRSFFLGVCSAAALVFKKLENPKGDFGALLQNFSF